MMVVKDYHDGLEAAIIIERAELNLVALLQPKLTVDGDQYCYLHGENLQDGVAGFGKSPWSAACDFSTNYYKELP